MQPKTMTVQFSKQFYNFNFLLLHWTKLACGQRGDVGKFAQQIQACSNMMIMQNVSDSMIC
jgi:hypothetical protein